MTPRRPLDETSRHFICSRFTTVPTPSYVYLLCIVLHGWHGVSAFFVGIHWIGKEAFCIVTIASFCCFGCLTFLLSVFSGCFFFAQNILGGERESTSPAWRNG